MVSEVTKTLGALSLILVVPGLSLLARANDASEVKQPYLEVGDCWSYRADRLYYGGWITNYEMCITHADPKKDLFLATAAVKDDGREIDLSFTQDWGLRTFIDGSVYAEPARFFRFPLRVGDKYSLEVYFQNGVQANGTLYGDWSIVVTGWEDVSVAAGRFRALRIEASGRVQTPLAVNRSSLFRTWWYVPEIRRYVRFEQRAQGQTAADSSWREELIRYRLNP